jgi:hypothetical protein
MASRGCSSVSAATRNAGCPAQGYGECRGNINPTAMAYVRMCLPALLALCALGATEVASGPVVRNAHAMIFDEERGTTVLFGGADAASVRGDTWTWDGTRWRQLQISGPPARTFPAFVWDARRKEALLFGGRRVLFGRDGEGDTTLSDTWTFGKTGWRRRNVPGPPPRTEAGIAYDAERGVAVLFGGYDDAGGKTVRRGDTWEWDGMRWEQRADVGPAPRSGVAMAYDAGLKRVVLFGGNGGPRSDTWTWDGVRWEHVVTPDTPGRFNSFAQYDCARNQLVRTTGWSGKKRVSETWVFDGRRWSLVATTGPSPRNHSALVFDGRRRRLVLHGGHDGTFVFGDTWEWDGRTWSQRGSTAPQRRINNGH